MVESRTFPTVESAEGHGTHGVYRTVQWMYVRSFKAFGANWRLLIQAGNLVRFVLFFQLTNSSSSRPCN